MLVSEMRAAALRRPRGHHRPARGRARRAVLRGLCRARRSGHRDQPDAEPARLHLGPRHRPRPRGGGPRQAQGRRRAAGEGRRRLPGLRHARLRGRRRASLPGLRAAPRARREERPSPAWMQRRLAAIGLRPINALVDITNYVTYDRGRPLHVFDAAKVKGDLTVRRARNGEEIVALDGRTYTLDDSIVVIADEDGAGVDRRHHGRRALGLRRDDDRRADRIGAVGPAQHRAIGPPARHPDRRALPLRARRRSGLHGARPRSRDPHGARALRRRGVRASRSRARSPTPAASSTSPGPRCGASRASTCRARNRRSSSRASASTLRAPATG